jgi:ATP/ADP translocase
MGGGIIAIIVGFFAAFFFLLWGILYYPIKRALKIRKNKKELSAQANKDPK